MKPNRKKKPPPKNVPASFSPSASYPKATQTTPKEKLKIITIFLGRPGLVFHLPLSLILNPIPLDEASNSLGG